MHLLNKSFVLAQRHYFKAAYNSVAKIFFCLRILKHFEFYQLFIILQMLLEEIFKLNFHLRGCVSHVKVVVVYFSNK